MKIFFALRILIRLVLVFGRELRAGNPYAVGAAGALAAVTVACALFWFARRPLGGDPQAEPAPDEAFRDERNPYRDAT